MAGRPFRALAPHAEIDSLSLEELREKFRELEESYVQAICKIVQFRQYVPDSIKNRDPFDWFKVEDLIKEGRSDDEIALAIGEPTRRIRSIRYEMGFPLRQRGRPKKPSNNS